MVTMARLFQPPPPRPASPQTCPFSVHRRTTLSATGLSAAAAVRDSRAKASAHPPIRPDAAAALPRAARRAGDETFTPRRRGHFFSFRLGRLPWARVE
jgi:hypothetical protein